VLGHFVDGSVAYLLELSSGYWVSKRDRSKSKIRKHPPPRAL